MRINGNKKRPYMLIFIYEAVNETYISGKSTCNHRFCSQTVLFFSKAFRIARWTIQLNFSQALLFGGAQMDKHPQNCENSGLKLCTGFYHAGVLEHGKARFIVF